VKNVAKALSGMALGLIMAMVISLRGEYSG